MSTINLAEGRLLFGKDPAAYARGRPEYPAVLYDRLRARCGLGSGSRVLEVGPGTGLATRRLLESGAASVWAVEPDRRLAAYLRDTLDTERLRIVEASFEDAALPTAAFDIGVAATAFHWLEQPSALAKARGALKPGGWWAMWWTLFGTGAGADAFERATEHLFADTQTSPSWSAGGDRKQFALDEAARLSDLAAAGFRSSQVDCWPWTQEFTTARLLDLYGTFSPVQALPDAERRAFLQSLSRIADEQFGGRTERPLLTVLYTALSP